MPSPVIHRCVRAFPNVWLAARGEGRRRGYTGHRSHGRDTRCAHDEPIGCTTEQRERIAGDQSQHLVIGRFEDAEVARDGPLAVRSRGTRRGLVACPRISHRQAGRFAADGRTCRDARRSRRCRFRRAWPYFRGVRGLGGASDHPSRAARWPTGRPAGSKAQRSRCLCERSTGGLGTGVAGIRGRAGAATREIVSSDWRALRCEMYASVTTTAHQTSTAAPPITNRRSAHRRTLAAPRRASPLVMAAHNSPLVFGR